MRLDSIHEINEIAIARMMEYARVALEAHGLEQQEQEERKRQQDRADLDMLVELLAGRSK